MAVDLSVFGNIKTKQDYDRINDEFMARKAAAAQALQAGQLDQQSKANIYATQVLSAAAAPTGQDASGNPIYNQDNYTTGLQHLASQGIDVSYLAPDVQTGARQIQAARLAQSPLGSLLNTATKFDTNNNTVALAGGSLPNDPNGVAKAVLGGGLGALVGQPIPPPAPVTAQPLPQSKFADMNLNTPIAKPDPTDAILNAQGSSAPVTTPQAVSPPPAAGVGFNPPQKDPSETLAAYNARVQQAFEQYKADPTYQANVAKATAAATAAGKDEGTQVGEAANSQEITDRLLQNLQALKQLNPSVPDSSFLGPDTKAYFSKRIGSGAEAGALAQWKQIDQQQILSDLAQLVKSGAIRSNRTIAQMLQTGSGISADEPVQARADLINNLLAEVQNKNTTIQNVNARLNGGEVQPYNQILAPGNSAISAPSGWSVTRVK